MTLLPAVAILAAACAPRLDIYRTRSIPWVGQTVQYAAALTGAAPGSRWKISIDVCEGDQRRLLAHRSVRADADGQALLTERVRWKEAGWHEVIASATSGDTALTARVAVPVTSYRVDFAWYGAQEGHELRWPTIQLTTPTEARAYWRRRGVIPAGWCGAMCGKDKPVEHFIRGWTSKPAIAIDEFGGSREYCEKFHRALVEVRKRRPHHFIAVWFCGCYDLWPKFRDLIDFFLPEVYLNYTTYNLRRFDHIVAHARKCGVFEKMLVGLGINMVRNKDGSVRYRPTVGELLDEVRYLKQIAPDLRGLAFFTYSSAELAVRAAMDQACEKYFLRPVADLAEVKVSPQAAPEGAPATIAATVRNASAMPGRGFAVRWFVSGRQVHEATVDLAAGEETSLSATFRPRAGAHVCRVEVKPPAGGSALRRYLEAPLARLADARAIVHVPPLPCAASATPSALLHLPQPLVLEGTSAVQADLLDETGTAVTGLPSGTIDLPDGTTLACWEPTKTARARGARADRHQFWRLLREPPPAARLLVTVRQERDGLHIYAPAYRAVLDPDSDSISSLRAAGSDTELLRTPWRMNWSEWQGFGQPKIQSTPAAAAVSIPVRGENLSGWTCYIFHPSCVEIRRKFTARNGPVGVEYAAEGAGIVQRAGTYALQFGAGARISRGRLRVSGEYRDLYFGAVGLSPEEAGNGGWFDFSWADDSPGLGVALAAVWQTRASKAGYDVTRYYDASDWFEVAYVWHKKISVASAYSRLYLIPHAHADLSDPQAIAPAQAVWERLRHPPRLLAR